jgi:hypothetical protein
MAIIVNKQFQYSLIQEYQAEKQTCLLVLIMNPDLFEKKGKAIPVTGHGGP